MCYINQNNPFVTTWNQLSDFTPWMIRDDLTNNYLNMAKQDACDAAIWGLPVFVAAAFLDTASAITFPVMSIAFSVFSTQEPTDRYLAGALGIAGLVVTCALYATLPPLQVAAVVAVASALFSSSYLF
ncbi:MAG: hypothetical protein FJZ58_02100 [Chlamydiae bacterium]|nr:hypothetical protein [Chlamydiota bacterium]